MSVLDPEAVVRLLDRAKQEVDAGLLPSCQLALGLNGRVEAFHTIGATNQTRYNIWSCTKAVVSSAVWLLWGEGALTPDTRVAEHVIGFDTNGKDVITVDHLMQHTAGIPRAPMWIDDWTEPERRAAKFADWRTSWEPGTRFEYHEFSAHWAMAALIEAVSGTDYRDFVHRRVTEPIGMARFRLGVPQGEQGDVATLVSFGERSTDEELAVAGLSEARPLNYPPDAGARMMNDPRARAAGVPAAGAIATAADLARFYQALLHNPDGMWKPEVLADATGTIRNTFPDGGLCGIPASRSRGVVIRGDDANAHIRHHFGLGTSRRAFGHDGAGGQIAWADPDTGLSFCYLTNGMDANRVREYERDEELANLAAACINS